MLKSMTAFARCQQQGEWGNLICEIRTVNSRYLDVIVRMPEELRDMEMRVRDLVRTLLTRGKLEFSLRFEAGPGLSHDYTVNHTLLKQLHAVISGLSSSFELKETVSPFEVLRWPGVLQQTSIDLSQVQQATLSLCEETCLAVVKIREKEGVEIKNCLLACLGAMDHEIAKVSERIEFILETQKQRLIEKIRSLNVELDRQRLEHEMVFWAQKVDVQEELQRLEVHIKEVRSIVTNGGVMGRRLDFLMQELNREANTLGSKSADLMTTQVSVELKVLIEQMREQVQNIE